MAMASAGAMLSARGAQCWNGGLLALSFSSSGVHPQSSAFRRSVKRPFSIQRSTEESLPVRMCQCVGLGHRGTKMFVRSLSRRALEGSGEGSSVIVEEQLSAEEEEDRANVEEILKIVELLRSKRDMTFNEVRLTIMIEDPRDVERRKQLGIEDDRGCSREDMGAALMEVYEGRIPTDRIVLRELTKEMLAWPNLEDEIAASRLPPVASPYAKVTNTGVDPRIAAERAKVDWDAAADILPGEEKKELGEILPPAVGYSFLYLVSSIPVVIGVAVVLILFLNSLQ